MISATCRLTANRLSNPQWGRICSTTTRSYATSVTSPIYTKTRNFVLGTLTIGATAFFIAYYFDSRSAVHKYVFMPALHTFTDAETSHRLAIQLAKWSLTAKDRQIDDDVLKVKIFGHTLSNPIGLAAGFDKHGEAIDGLLEMGFGYMEIGSVTPQPQPGNSKPRFFRLPHDNAVINRYGFNSIGHEGVLANLRERVRKYFSSHKCPAPIPPTINNYSDSVLNSKTQIPRSLHSSKLLFINLGKNKFSDPESVSDYIIGIERLAPYADAIVINVSSPNTPGLRGLMRRGLIEEVLDSVVHARDNLIKKSHTNQLIKENDDVHNNDTFNGEISTDAIPKTPILIKISPDLSDNELVDIASAAIEKRIEGIIVANTTISRPEDLLSDTSLVAETGGLSGKPVKALSLKTITNLAKYLHQHDKLATPKDNVEGKIHLIGCGGIFNGDDVLDYARAGATLVEIYTALGYEGVGLPRKLKNEVSAKLKSQNMTWKDIVGIDILKNTNVFDVPDQHIDQSQNTTEQAKADVAVDSI